MKAKITTEFPEMAYLLAFCEDKHLARLYARLQLWQRMGGLKHFFGFSEAIDAKLRIWFNDHTLAGRAVMDTASLEALLNQNSLAESVIREIIQMLVNPSRSIFKKKIHDITPLQTAVHFRDLEMVRALLAEGAKVDYETVRFAVNQRPDSGIFAALKEGKKAWQVPISMDVSSITIEKPTDTGLRSEFWEITKPVIERIRTITLLLIEHGDESCMHKTGCWGETLLHRACNNDDVEIVYAMLKAGAAVNRKDRNGEFPRPLQENGHYIYMDELQAKGFYEALVEAPLSEAEKMYKRWMTSSYFADESDHREQRIRKSSLTYLLEEIKDPQQQIAALKYALEVDEAGKPCNVLSYLMHSVYFRVGCGAIHKIKARLCEMQELHGVEYGAHRGTYHSKRPYLLVYGPQQTVHPHPMKNTMGDQRMESLGM